MEGGKREGGFRSKIYPPNVATLASHASSHEANSTNGLSPNGLSPSHGDEA